MRAPSLSAPVARSAQQRCRGRRSRVGRARSGGVSPRLRGVRARPRALGEAATREPGCARARPRPARFPARSPGRWTLQGPPPSRTGTKYLERRQAAARTRLQSAHLAGADDPQIVGGLRFEVEILARSEGVEPEVAVHARDTRGTDRAEELRLLGRNPRHCGSLRRAEGTPRRGPLRPQPTPSKGSATRCLTIRQR